MLNSFDDPRLFCSILNPEYEDKANKIMQENIKPAPSFSTPIFNSTPVFEKEAPINLNAFEPNFASLSDPNRSPF